jgi:hypothetical protein
MYYARRNGSFEAQLDQLPEVNEHTAFDLILEKMPAQFRPQLVALKPQLLPVVEERLVEILQGKVQRIVAEMST